MADSKLQSASILEVALSNPKLSILCDICCKAGIDQTLRNDGPYTFFAPTNEAFARLDKEVLKDLLLPQNREELITLLTYHIIASKLPSKTLKVGKLRTLSGKRCELGRRQGKLCIDEALIIHSDLECANGYIHAIDRVILPTSSL